MVLTRTHGIDKDLWYRQGLMVLTTPMVLTKTHGIESVLLNHTRTRGPSVTCMRDFLIKYLKLNCLYYKISNKLYFKSNILFWSPYTAEGDKYLKKKKINRL